MPDRRRLFGLVLQMVAGGLALVGLAMLLIPGIDRGLGRPGGFAPWAFARIGADAPQREPLLGEAELAADPERWRVNRQRWEEMAPADRERMIERYHALERLGPKQREQLLARFRELSELTPAERAAMARKAESLARFERTLSWGELAELEALGSRRRAARLVELYRQRHDLD